MGKKKKSDSLGRALIKDRFSSKGHKNDSMLHSSELNDGYDWGRLNLQSVTEESSFDDFLRTAELAGTEFQAEKLNVEFVTPEACGVLSPADRQKFEKIKKDKAGLLRIPRRPEWDSQTTGEELQARERESFLDWRRGLAALQETEGLVLTPYEKNLDFWRQLWRVIERSDIVVQIVDARNPLLFRCEDLEKYTEEVCSDKMSLLLLNKSDYLSPAQRRAWAEYLGSTGVRCAFYSALNGLQEQQEMDSTSGETKDEGSKEGPGASKEGSGASKEGSEASKEGLGATNEGSGATNDTDPEPSQDAPGGPSEGCLNSCALLNGRQLIRWLSALLPPGAGRVSPGLTTVGLVGYPNVGKSSTINSLMGAKKVSVSATPGKTKHFQTLLVEDSDVMLCDCPGLVFPSLVATKADMLLSGILPVDQMRDYTQAVSSLRSLVPDHVFQDLYGILIPEQPPGLDPTSPYTLLSSYAYSRGFMTANGCPDMSRAARLILKDFVNGRLLHCTAPPSASQQTYHPFPPPARRPPRLTPVASRAIADRKMVTSKDLDGSFFDRMSLGSHTKGAAIAGAPTLSQSSSSSGGGQAKPWKDHSHKRNKKEKLRRLYRHLDE